MTKKLIFLFLFGGVFLLSACGKQKPTFQTPEVLITNGQASSARTSLQSSFHVVSSRAPRSVLLQVPFQPQAPFAKWDALHEEACEEMSLLLVHHFKNGTMPSKEQVERELQALIGWEEENGFAQDVAVGELASIAHQYFGYQTRVMENPTVDDLRRELVQGKPILFPAAGRLLRNPFFSGDGPPYHMILLVGYDERGFITHDVGTKRGEQYWYSNAVILNALHDWTGVKEDIEQGPKRALVVE